MGEIKQQNVSLRNEMKEQNVKFENSTNVKFNELSDSNKPLCERIDAIDNKTEGLTRKIKEQN